MMSPAVAFKDNAAEMMTEPTYMVALSPIAAREAGPDIATTGGKSLTGAFMGASEISAASQPAMAANIPAPLAANPAAQIVMNAESAGASLQAEMTGVRYQPPQSDLSVAAEGVYKPAAELATRMLDFFRDTSLDNKPDVIEPTASNPAPPQQHFTLG